jgi:DNA-binding response OmpR family regulator
LRNRWPHLRVLFMSGYTDSVIGRYGELEPGSAMLEKPFTRDELLERVRSMLAGPSS